MSDEERTHRLEASFRRQYRDLDDEELREIACGDVPWAAGGGHFLLAARRAARATLLERGAARVPHVPRWDPHIGRLPTWARLLAACVFLAAAAAALAIYRAAAPGDAASTREACGAALEMAAGTELARRYDLGFRSCALDLSSATASADMAVLPIVAVGCIRLSERQVRDLTAAPNPAEVAELRRYAARPAPGRHCSAGPVPFAELLLREGRPWTVRLAVPEPL